MTKPLIFPSECYYIFFGRVCCAFIFDLSIRQALNRLLLSWSMIMWLLGVHEGSHRE